MSAITEFDVGPLTWVKGEIDQALVKARENLAQLAENQDDLTPLRFCLTHLHQVSGAIQMVGLEGVARFSSEIEKLLTSMEKQELAISLQRIELLKQAIANMAQYLDDLINGQPDLPLKLYPAYESLLQARGVEKVSESDLFFPDLSTRAPKNAAARQVPEAEFPRFVRNQRSFFQRGLLQWLRGDTKGLQDMRAALQAIDQTQALPAHRTFWWAAIAFVESLANEGLKPDFNVKQLCARIDIQLRRLGEGSSKVAERLLRDVLYFVAKSVAVSDSVKEVKRVFELDDYLPAEVTQSSEEEANLARLQPLLRDLRDALSAAKDSWLKYTSGNKDSLAHFQQQSGKLRDKSDALGNQPMQNLAHQISTIASNLSGIPEANRDNVAMEMATALLLMENALENYSRLTPEFDQQSEVQVKRLQASAYGKTEEAEIPDIPLLDEMSRKAQEKLLLAQVAHEIQSNLRHIELVLDTFFRDSSTRNELPTLDPIIHQVSGALTILDLAKAVELLSASQNLIHKFSQPDYVTQQQELELVAEALSSLGFYVEAIQFGRADAENIIVSVLNRMTGNVQDEHSNLAIEATEEVELEEPQISVEAGLEDQKKQLQTSFDQWQQKPEDETARQNLQTALTELRQDADLVADSELNSQASHALTLLSQSSEVQAPELASAIAEMTASNVQAVAPSAEAARMLDASEEAVDAELLETYLEEAQEVLERIQENLKLSHANLHDKEALVTLRRAFHTLKGSGRMVGLTTLGEVAWGIEQVMNLWLEEEKSATPELLEFITQAHDAFAVWVEQLSSRGSADVQADALMAMAEQLKHREESIPAQPEAEQAEVIEMSLPAVSEEDMAVEETAHEKAEPELVLPSLELPENEWEEEIELPQVNESIDLPAESQFALEQLDEPETIDSELEVIGLSATENVAVENEVDSVISAIEVISEEAEAEAEAAEQDVVIGDVTLSSALFGILMKEAEQHIATLEKEFDGVTVNPELPIEHDFMRAAHTLCGISRTTGFPSIAELGNALELWLQEQLEHPQPFTEKQIKVMGDSITGLKKMVKTIGEFKQPKAAKQIIRSLQAMLKKAVAERDARNEKESREAKAVEEAQAKALQSSLDAEKEMARADVSEEDKTQLVEVPQSPVEPVNQITQPETGERRVIHDDIDEQLLPIFLEEAQELFPEIGGLLRDLRANPADENISHSLQRGLHTLKGSSRMAGAMRLGELTHNMEDKLITAIESGSLPTAIFDELETDFDRVGDALERLKRGEESVPEMPAEMAVQKSGADETSVTAGMTFGDLEQAAQKALLRVRADVIDRLVNEAGEVSIARSRIEGEMQGFKQSLLDLTENVIRLRNQLREVEIQAESQMQSRLTLIQDEETKAFDPLEFDRFTRFQELTRMMAESVNDVSTVQQNLLKNLDETEAALLQQARMNRELQQELMHIRMVPLNSLTERLYRIVRQTAKELGKKVNLDIRGANVELDRSVLEKMTAPFEHLLRNAIAHGLENKETRLAAGKQEIGEIQLDVRQAGNEIILKFSDDGAGIDLDAIRLKAKQLGMLEEGIELSDAQLMELIFSSGFSTASEVTQVAGRGIGMDVVRSEVAELGGRIELTSERGKGTVFTIYLPLTLAVTQTVLIQAGTELFAIPSSMVEQVQELKTKALADVYEKREVEWMGNHYPFFYLPRLLGDEAQQPLAKTYNSVLLLRSGTQRVAIHVDELVGNREIVVKNIGPQLARVSGIAGATVLGNGRVVLILNPVQLGHREVIPVVTAKVTSAAVEEKPSSVPLIMVVDDSLTVRKITSRLLSREGYQVITAKDGVEALQELQDNMPAVMLVDIEMPRMDGFELTRNVRGDAKTSHIPIIMITSRTAEKHRNYAKELGVDVYLGKPYQEEELLGHIENFVKANAQQH